MQRGQRCFLAYPDADACPHRPTCIPELSICRKSIAWGRAIFQKADDQSFLHVFNVAGPVRAALAANVLGRIYLRPALQWCSLWVSTYVPCVPTAEGSVNPVATHHMASLDWRTFRGGRKLVLKKVTWTSCAPRRWGGRVGPRAEPPEPDKSRRPGFMGREDEKTGKARRMKGSRGQEGKFLFPFPLRCKLSVVTLSFVLSFLSLFNTTLWERAGRGQGRRMGKDCI